MFLKKSRYKNSRFFDVDESGHEVFAGIRPRQINSAEGVLEYIVKSGDRLDLLANNFYNNDRLWWRIADANPQFIFSGYMLDDDMVGDVLLIPKIK